MYRISQKVISKKKRSPVFILLYVAALSAFFSLPQGGEGFDLVRFLVVFGFTAVLAAGSNYLGTRKFLKYAASHSVELTEKGLSSVEFDTSTTLPWDKVTAVNCKKKRGSVSKLVLKTSSSGALDLSRYDNLDELATELKSYVDSSLWK
ncbi:hypothetical protein [Marinomonas mediterranea]|uniref:hypothetical protein n=1 Tax=Marinomonas mediterranea TaxID=119864 RepID=UPI00234C02E1|nr:hypothetical protein [Marinomonas mediterranea]WCN09953.1 hypothetical protein GV055_14005 [Marinomonas mediterranea]